MRRSRFRFLLFGSTVGVSQSGTSLTDCDCALQRAPCHCSHSFCEWAFVVTAQALNEGAAVTDLFTQATRGVTDCAVFGGCSHSLFAAHIRSERADSGQ